MKVIVGLGNPGSQYEGTRHNVGFDVIDYLAGSPSTGPWREKFEAAFAELRDGHEVVLLVKPLTFMNLSGRAVRAILDFYKLEVVDLLVVCDDFNLPLGKLRLRKDGSAGGQNGLKNIQLMLGTDVYPRLRLGVGAPQHDNAVGHVLGRWKPGERKAVDEMIAKAAEAALLFVNKGLDAAMNRFNAGETPPKNNDKPKLVAPPVAAGGPGPNKPTDPQGSIASPADPR